MRVGKQKQGYTVVEVMIFLAVSGFMFVIAANFINGKQAKSEFRQGVSELNSQVEQVINDVTNGYYPSNGNFACAAGNTRAAPLTFGGAAPSGGQGSNQGCAFIGKVMQFSVGTANSANYNIYSIVGRQFQTDNKSLVSPANFNEAQPVAMTGDGGTTNLTQSKRIEWGLSVNRMTANGTDIAAFGFLNGFASSDSDNALSSGSATPVTVAFLDSRPGKTSTDAYGWVKALEGASAHIATNPNIVMCLGDGSGQYGRLTIGTSDNVQGQKLVTHVQIDGKVPAAGSGCPA